MSAQALLATANTMVAATSRTDLRLTHVTAPFVVTLARAIFARAMIAAGWASRARLLAAISTQEIGFALANTSNAVSVARAALGACDLLAANPCPSLYAAALTFGAFSTTRAATFAGAVLATPTCSTCAFKISTACTMARAFHGALLSLAGFAGVAIITLAPAVFTLAMKVAFIFASSELATFASEARGAMASSCLIAETIARAVLRACQR